MSVYISTMRHEILSKEHFGCEPIVWFLSAFLLACVYIFSAYGLVRMSLLGSISIVKMDVMSEVIYLTYTHTPHT